MYFVKKFFSYREIRWKCLQSINQGMSVYKHTGIIEQILIFPFTVFTTWIYAKYLNGFNFIFILYYLQLQSYRTIDVIPLIILFSGVHTLH